MKTLRRLLVILSVCTAVVAQEPASVEGIATVAGSDEPVPGVVMELRRGSGEPLLAASQSDGRFLFRNVPPGRYLLVGSRNGFLPNGRGIPVVIAAGQRITALRLTMTPTAAVSGRIADSAGQPMPGVLVQLLKPAFQDGRRVMSVMKSMVTNDLGEYRIFWVTPDSYYVNVIPPGDTAQGGGLGLVMNPAGQPAGRSLWSNQSNVAVRPAGSGLPENEAYLPVFFPGTVDDSAARAVDLQPGADVRSIDIRVTPVRAWRIRGLVLNGTTRQPMPNANLQLISVAPGSARVHQTTSDAMGMYAIPRVPAGPYVLLANAAGIGRLMNIEVRESDIETTVELQPFYSISGRVNASNPAALAVRLRLDFPIPNPPQLNTTPAADGTFAFRTVPPGDYRVFVAPLLVPQVPTPPSLPAALQNSYVKTITLGNTDLLNGRLRVDRPPESQIDIQIAKDPGSVNGRALDIRQEPIPGATIVFMPDVERRAFRADLFKVVTSDESGRFLLEGIPPGDYRIFAWEKVADNAWQDPAFMRAAEDKGKAVRIVENARQSLEVTAIP